MCDGSRSHTNSAVFWVAKDALEGSSLNTVFKRCLSPVSPMAPQVSSQLVVGVLYVQVSQHLTSAAHLLCLAVLRAPLPLMKVSATTRATF